MDARHRELLDLMHGGALPSADDLRGLIADAPADAREYAAGLARSATLARFGDAVFVRGLIECTNYCKNDCLYCGIRAGNSRAERYRLAPEEILECCGTGYELGFRTFVLQGGEDAFFTDDVLVRIVEAIRAAFPGCAVTLSFGERSPEGYARLRRAGADRYLLRHETADAAHYSRLHPEGMTLSSRIECLRELKRLGFQTGAGFMVGSPFQTAAALASDVLFLRELRPEMAGIGPFLPHGGTPFGGYPPGDVDLTLFMLSLVRLALPCALLPATTALGTARQDGLARGILSGANVVMPNLSPARARDRYVLYDGKARADRDIADNLSALRDEMAAIGRRIVVDRGDYAEREIR
ncbi:MAG: [FeFe] hydrogenase H-cluster radical SAM maturase HydE [Planctomycetota bacterium]|jgi:biotin synthase|nr:[FeFe] hydrogenase H-cluster radical SAM maturase HydE [Planctomycetota bacterium]